MTAAPAGTVASGGHVPVLLDRVLDVLRPRDDGIYVDGTFGAGGYARAILDTARCTVYGIDRDPDAIRRGQALARRYAGRLHLVEGRFGEMDRLLHERRVEAVDGIALDLGASSMQLDEASRGFSFRADGPLDMRMDGRGPSAADIVNTLPGDDLARILRSYGEERQARRIARALVEARREAPIERTGRLAEIVRRAIGARARKVGGIDPATRTFQALRIHVNDELGELDRGLRAAERLLAPGGRLAVVSFHSLEDRRVKAFLRERSGETPAPSRHLPAPDRRGPAPSFRLLFRRAVRPTPEEIARNPRARSARLRAAERSDAPAWPAEAAA